MNKTRNNDHYHFYNFRLEDFFDDFNGTSNTYLNKIGVLNEGHRSNLMRMFVKQDTSIKPRKHHSTKGQYDKQQQLDYLLSSKERCNYLKTMTLKMDYIWSHPEYC